jgi:hypothetical protein
MMRVDPSGEFWWIAVSAIIGGINSHSNGGSFWGGALVGAVSGAISWGASTAVSSLFSTATTNMWTNLAINAGSGALSSGLVNEAMGGDFWSGAKQGAISGAVTTGVSWGMEHWFGDSLAEWAGNNKVKASVVNGIQGMTEQVVMRGNPVAGFAYSTASSLGYRMVDRGLFLKLGKNYNHYSSSDVDANGENLQNKSYWEYSQSTGRLTHVDSDGTRKFVATGYAGQGEGLNNPDMQDVKHVGPIPRGTWDIGNQYNHTVLGRHVMNLTPRAGTNTFNRTAFRIHGDNSYLNYSASEGCIILGLKVRDQIAKSGDNILRVIK